MENLSSHVFDNSRNGFCRFEREDVHLIISNILYTVSNNVESMAF